MVVQLDLNSLTIAVISLIPTLVLAIKVEKHYTGFWTGAWNLFAIFLAGITLILVPATTNRIFVLFDRTPFDLSWLLIFYAIVVALIGFKVDADALRKLASSKLTAGILLSTLVAQYFLVSDLGTLASILIGTPVLLWMMDKSID